MSGKLDPRAARALTDREVTKLIGGQIFTLLEMSEPDAVRTALQYILDHWDHYRELFEVLKAHELQNESGGN